MYNIDAFAIPINVGTLGESSRELNRKLVEDTFHAYDNVEIEERTGIHIEQTISGLERNYVSYQALASILSEYSKQIVKHTGTHNTDIQAEFFWANINRNPSAFHMPHAHQLDGYMWTGVYFPTSGWKDGKEISEEQNLDEVVDITSRTQPLPGSLTLMDPLHFVKTGVATKRTDRYPYWGNPITIEPKEGTVVLFPTYLPHLVTPTESENFTRMSIAFYVRVHNGNGGIDK